MFQLVKTLASAVATAAAGKGWLFLDTNSGGPAVKDENGVVMLLAPQAIRLQVVSGAVSAGTGLHTFRMPFKFKVTAVRATLKTAQTTDGGGGVFTVDINEAGTTILSTKLTIDNTELTSTTAAVPAVISDSILADDALITVDVDAIGDGTALGLDVYLIGYPIG